MQFVKVSVVISSYTEQRLDDILRCISSLRKQTLSPTEIILVLDPSEKLVRFYRSRLPPSVKIIVSTRFGLSHARNTGIQAAKGTVIAFIDDDAQADEDWLSNLMKNYKDPNVMGVGGFVAPKWHGHRPQWFPEELDWIIGCSYKGLPTKKSLVRNPLGCNMSFRSEILKEVGYFKSNIGRMGTTLLSDEETEISMRILREIPNAKLIYDPSAVVHHNVDIQRASLPYIWKRSFYEGISKAAITAELNSSNARTALAYEGYYMKYLLRVAIPSRMKRIFNPKSILQLLTLIASTSAVFLGYISHMRGKH